MRSISNIDVSIIRSLRSKGHSLRDVARRSGFSHTTVKSLTVRKDADIGDVNKGGRPKILSSSEERLLVRKFELGIWKTAREAAKQLSKEIDRNVGRLTIARILKRHGLKSYRKPKRPCLSKIHKKQRRVFARLAKQNPIEHWKNVIFTDESRISLFGPDGNKCAWRQPGLPLLDHHVTQTVKF
jgi:transposase